MIRQNVPFKTPVDYFKDVLDSDYNNINHFKDFWEEKKWMWKGYDCDLHIYPYVHAQPALLSVGCPNQCSFCPTAQVHKGHVYFGDPKVILPPYRDKNVHFMDENFFCNDDIEKILSILLVNKIKWLAMSDYKSTKRVFEQFGEEYLYACGLRVVEMGLENVALFKKVERPIPAERIAIYYLNMTCFPGETKETIIENAEWMKPVSLERPIHSNNGVWYACGQFLYNPVDEKKPGRFIITRYARVHPTWVPKSLLVQDYKVVDLESANFYSQLVYGIKEYNPPIEGNIGDFIGAELNATLWMLTGIRCGAII